MTKNSVHGSEKHRKPDSEERAFRHLIGAYFNQDFDLRGEDASGVLASFVREPRETVVAARDFARALLLRTRANELESRLEALDLTDYDPEAEGLTYLDWLELVERDLTAAIEDSD